MVYVFDAGYTKVDLMKKETNTSNGENSHSETPNAYTLN